MEGKAMDIKSLLKQFVISEIVVDTTCADIRETESLIDNGILDSLGIIKILTFIEDKFSIKISDDELVPENFETLYSISNLIDKKICNEVVN